MLTTDRIGGSAFCLLALFVMWESRALPLGTWRQPGPGYFPMLLAALLLILGALDWAMGGSAAPVAGVGWGEARHALVILGVSVFICFGLERLGYRLTMLSALLFFVWLVERKNLLATAGAYHGGQVLKNDNRAARGAPATMPEFKT